MYSVSSCVRKFEKATVSFVVSFCLALHLSVRLHKTTRLLLKDFHEILCMCNFRKSVEKIRFLENLTRKAAGIYYTILYCTVLYFTILYYTILYYTILYNTILYYTILYYTILYYTTLYYTILYYTILYYTILYYTILYYTILYYTSKNRIWEYSTAVKGTFDIILHCVCVCVCARDFHCLPKITIT